MMYAARGRAYAQGGWGGDYPAPGDMRPEVRGAEEDHYHHDNTHNPRRNGADHARRGESGLYAGTMYPPTHKPSPPPPRPPKNKRSMIKSSFGDNFMFKPEKPEKLQESASGEESPDPETRDKLLEGHEEERYGYPGRDRDGAEEFRYREDNGMQGRRDDRDREAPRRMTIPRPSVRDGQPFNYMTGNTDDRQSHDQYPTNPGMRVEKDNLHREPVPGPDNSSSIGSDAEAEMDAYLEDLIDESFDRVKEGDKGVWGKLIYMERDYQVVRFNLRERDIVIDGTDRDPAIDRISLGKYENPHSDKRTQDIKRTIKKGLRLCLERDGSVSASRLERGCDVFVGEINRPAGHCFSPELIQYGGQLPIDNTVKLFDMRTYKKNLRSVWGREDADDVVPYNAFTWMSLKEQRDHLLDTPCWLILVHYGALRLHDAEKAPEVDATPPPSRRGASQKRRRTLPRSHGVPNPRQSRITRDWDDRHREGDRDRTMDQSRWYRDQDTSRRW